jgi:hypothetical protein
LERKWEREREEERRIEKEKELERKKESDKQMEFMFKLFQDAKSVFENKMKDPNNVCG